MARKLSVIALEMPARDQPVAADIGSRKTASENIAPMATQVMSAPAATITQRYDDPICKMLLVRLLSTRSGCGFLGQDEWEPAEDAGPPDLFLG